MKQKKGIFLKQIKVRDNLLDKEANRLLLKEMMMNKNI